MILYNNIFPEGISLKDVLVEENKVKFINVGNTLVYDTFSHIEYGTPTLTISYPVMDRGGCSGTLTVSPTITYTLPATTYGYSGKSYDTIILTGNVTDFTASGRELNSSGAWIDNNTGEVYRESLNTTYKSSEWSIMEVTITAIINGISISKKAIVRMQSNTYTDTPTTTTYGDIIVPPIVNGVIPASGGIATAKAENAKQSYIVKAGTRTYQTGCLETIGQSSNGERIIYPDCSLILSSAESRGTSISDLTVIRSLKVTWEGYGDKIVEDTMYIYLEANYVTSVDIVDDLFLYTEKASANGGEITPITHQEVKLTFTSGDSVTTSDSSYPGGSITYNRDLSVMNWGGASHFMPDSGWLLFLDLVDNIKNERSTEVQSILTVTFTHLSTQGGSILGFSTKYAKCYLEGNYIININVHIDSEFLYPACGLNGGIVTPQNVNHSATYYYSSGTSSNDTPHTNYGSLLILTEYTLSGTRMASIDSSTGKLIWEPNTSTSSLVGIITLGVTYIWTHNNDYGSTSVTGYNSRTATAILNADVLKIRGRKVVFENLLGISLWLSFTGCTSEGFQLSSLAYTETSLTALYGFDTITISYSPESVGPNSIKMFINGERASTILCSENYLNESAITILFRFVYYEPAPIEN